MKLNYKKNCFLHIKAFLIVLFISTSSCSLNKKDNDWAEENLRGKVKSLSEISYKAVEKFGEIKTGNRERDSWSENDRLIIFDQKGNKIEENIYASDGNLRKKYTFEYDNLGNLSKKNRYNFDGSLYEKHTYEYDDKGNLVIDNSYWSDGSLKIKLTYKYDNIGNVIKEQKYRSDGTLLKKYRYQYDNKGNLVKKNRHESDGIIIIRPSQTTIWMWTYKYDDKGNIIEVKEYDSVGNLDNVKNFKYEYDSKGNWVKRIDFINEKPKYILIREHKYY